jgi:hypothetical protein
LNAISIYFLPLLLVVPRDAPSFKFNSVSQVKYIDKIGSSLGNSVWVVQHKMKGSIRK